jgi:hypothetical protein
LFGLRLCALGSFRQFRGRRICSIAHGGRGGCDGCGRKGSVERTDSRFAARQRAPLVAIERRRPSNRGAIQGHSGEKVATRVAHARDIDLRGGDPGGQPKPDHSGVGPGNGARQGGNIVC